VDWRCCGKNNRGKGEACHAALGSVSVTDANAPHPGGSSWTAPGSVTAGAIPETGRVLLGAVNVMATGGVKVGSNEVVVEHVSP
jgi:hypothetical protein